MPYPDRLPKENIELVLPHKKKTEKNLLDNTTYTMYSGILTKKELETEKKKRNAILDEYEKRTVENRDKMLSAKVPYINICVIARMIQIIRMVKKFRQRL